MPHQITIAFLAMLLSNYLPVTTLAQEAKKNDATSNAVGEKVSKIDEAAIAALSAKIKKQPGEAQHYRNRGIEYAKGHAWKKAAADFMLFEKHHGGDSFIGTQVGLMLLLANDEETYQELCEEMLAGYEESASSSYCERTAKLCALRSKPIGDRNKLLKMARKGLAKGRKFKYAVNHYRTLALVQYRAEKYDDALNTIRAGVARNNRASFKRPAAVAGLNIIKAMCLKKQAKNADAKSSLAEAKLKLDKVFKDEARMYQEPDWHDWLINRILYEEAKLPSS